MNFFKIQKPTIMSLRIMLLAKVFQWHSLVLVCKITLKEWNQF